MTCSQVIIIERLYGKNRIKSGQPLWFWVKWRILIMRVKVTLECTECKQRNYNTMKDKKNTPDRIELNKYCPFCKKHTLHKETK